MSRRVVTGLKSVLDLLTVKSLFPLDKKTPWKGFRVLHRGKPWQSTPGRTYANRHQSSIAPAAGQLCMAQADMYSGTEAPIVDR